MGQLLASPMAKRIDGNGCVGAVAAAVAVAVAVAVAGTAYGIPWDARMGYVQEGCTRTQVQEVILVSR